MPMKRYKSVDDFFDNAEVWKRELDKLRSIVNSMPLDECFKWSFPCYTFAGKNVVGICGFKQYFGLWFFQGALLDDSLGVLHTASEGKTKTQRQWRMTSPKDIKIRSIKSYIHQAIAIVEDGRENKPNRSKPVVVPTELRNAFVKNRKAAAAFKKLTKGKQREYADHISEAKRSTTKERRIQKIIPMIVQGVGLNDKYRNC